MPKRWRLLTVFTSLIILGLLLWGSPPKNFQGLFNENSSTDRSPVTYFIGSKITQYSDNGDIAYTLEAEETLYFDEDINDKPEVTMKTPKFEIYNEQRDSNAVLWKLSSLYAEGSEQEDRWRLKDKVVLTQRTKRGDWSTLTTTELLFKPREHYAETDKPVTINSPSGTTKAIGLKIFLDDERIELLSNVTSQYRPYTP